MKFNYEFFVATKAVRFALQANVDILLQNGFTKRETYLFMQGYITDHPETKMMAPLALHWIQEYLDSKKE